MTEHTVWSADKGWHYVSDVEHATIQRTILDNIRAADARQHERNRKTQQ